MSSLGKLESFLSQTPFFGGLSGDGLSLLAGMLLRVDVPAGAAVFAEGDAGHSMFVVGAGTLMARQAGPNGRSVKLMRFAVGDFFGETNLIEMHARPYTVVAEREALLYELTNVSLYQLYQKDQKAYILVLQNLARELARRLRRAGNRLTETAGTDEATLIQTNPGRRR